MGSAAVLEEEDYSVTVVSETLAEWVRGALALLDEARDMEILTLRLGLRDGEKQTLEKVGRRLGVTRERVRQVQRKALANLSGRVERDYSDDTARCMRRMEAFAERVGERLASEDLATALSYAVGDAASANLGLLRLVVDDVHARPRQASLRRGAAALPSWDDDGRHAERKPLGAVDSRVVRALMESATPLSLDKLDSAIRRVPEARDALADWPDLDLRLRVEFMLGVRVDGDGLCALTDRAHSRLSKRSQRLLALTSVIRDAGRPLHYKEISRRIRPLLPDRFAMSDRNVHAWIDRYKDHFKWAGPGIYGLAEWDIGVHDGKLDEHLKPARRTGIGDEIALLLTERGEPIPMAELEERILARFEVNRTSVSASVSQDKAGRFRTLAGGRVALSVWPARATRRRGA